MAELTVAMTYGNALYQAAKDMDKVDIVLEEGREILEIIHRESDFQAFINAPTISANEKKEVFENIFQGKICQELLNFMFILIDKGRTKYYEEILHEFQELVDTEEGVLYGTIYSVIPLSVDKITKFQQEAGKLLFGNVILKNEIDKSLIGGIRILVDGTIIDASLRSRLDNLSKTLT